MSLARSIGVRFATTSTIYHYLVPENQFMPNVGDFVVTNTALFNASNPLAYSSNPESKHVWLQFGIAKVVELNSPASPYAKKEFVAIIPANILKAREARFAANLQRQQEVAEARAKLDAMLEQYKREVVLDLLVRSNPEARRLHDIVEGRV